MDRHYSEWTDDLIARMWLMEQVCPPDCDEAKEFVTTFTNGDFTSSYVPKEAVDSYLECYIGMVLDKCGFPCTHHPNGTQAFPDYDVAGDWIEVKSFDASTSPSFDIITYDRLIRKLSEGDPDTLYADYIVLGYQYDNGSFYLESVGKCKIWEMVNYYVDNDGNKRVSVNANGVIRPRGDLRLNDNSNPPSFDDEYEFIVALRKSIEETDGEYEADRWMENVQNRTLI